MRSTNHLGLGKRISLRHIVTTTSTVKKHKKTPKTRTMKISEPAYELLRNHSRKYHEQPISYDDIIGELCNYWNAKHEQKYFTI